MAIKSFCTAITLFVVLSGARPTFAQTNPLRGLDSALKDLARKVTPSIVEVRASVYGTARYRKHNAQNEDTEDSDAALVTGSGVIVDSRGYIITNAHVVQDAIHVEVILDRRSSDDSQNVATPVAAQIVGQFKEADLAVLKVQAEGLRSIRIGPENNVKQGQLVAAFGSPLGLRDSISLGIVSSVARQIDGDDHASYIQTDAAINHGNSGGALVDMDGALVGITTLYYSEGGGSEGLGFAIPEPLVMYVFQQIVQRGEVRWADSGLRLQTISRSLARGLRLSRDYGLVVSDVAPSSAAQAAGIQPRDVLIAVDGIPVNDLPHYFERMYRKKPGEELSISVTRDNHPLCFRLKLTTQATDKERATRLNSAANLILRLGVVCSSLDPKSLAFQSSLRSRNGVIVEGLAASGDLKADLVRGDVIRSVNRTDVSTVDEVRAALEKVKPGSPVVLQVERKGEFIFIVADDDPD